jgi:hypothetical protein
MEMFLQGFGEGGESERPEHFVKLQRSRVKDLRESSLSDPAAQLHLPEPILRMDVPDGEHQLVFILRQDMGDAEFIAVNFDRLMNTIDGNAAVGDRE